MKEQPPRPTVLPFVRLRQQVGRLAKELLEGARHSGHIRDQLAQHDQLSTQVSADMTQHLNTVRGVEQNVDGVSLWWRRQSTRVERFIRTNESLPRAVLDEKDVMDRLARMAAGTRPILVGPWTGEVGFELLYWIPFVRWFVEHHGVDRSRLHVISRGGPVSWYRDLTSSYSDILTHYSPDQFRARMAEHGRAKQQQFRPFDREIVRRALLALGTRRVSLLHPCLMYRRFRGYWGDRTPLREAMNLMSHRRPEMPAPIPGLPARYVAVRFYFSTGFPDTPANRRIVAETVAALMKRTDVVFLNTGFRVDDHHDFTPESSHRLHTVDHVMTPERNLEVQSAVIARADAFVGSYGGLSYLPPLFGIPSVAMYSHRAFKSSHLDLAKLVFEEAVPGQLFVVDVADRALLRRALRYLAPVTPDGGAALSTSA